jgi:hypothetical protein
VRQASRERGGGLVAERLRERRGEIEQATLARVYAIADPVEAQDPTYADGLRAAVSAALDYGLAAIERTNEPAPAIPTTLLAQARLAARNDVDLDTVLRRYFAGYTLFGDFLIQEAEGEADISGAELQRLLRAEAVFFDRLVVAVSEEYAREEKSRPQGSERRRAEAVKRLLGGELIDTSELAYDFEGWHLGLAATGRDSAEAIHDLGRSLDRRVLLVRQDRDTTWAWLGGRRRVDPAELISDFEFRASAQVTMALGEPGEGLRGWRLSHRQAAAAMSVARRQSHAVRYRDVALLASVLQDDVLVASLRQLYLEPLEHGRDGGEVAKQTLQRYFSVGRNASSTAASMGVTRNTVINRLRAIEQRIGRPVASCNAELEAALHLDELSEQEHLAVRAD